MFGASFIINWYSKAQEGNVLQTFIIIICTHSIVYYNFDICFARSAKVTNNDTTIINLQRVSW